MDSDVRPDWSGRLDRLQSSLASRGIDALAVSTPLNIAYLTGFTGSAGLLLVGPDESVLITDGRYEFIVRQAQAEGTIVRVPVARVEVRYDLTLTDLVGRRGCRRVGFEARHATVAILRAWERRTPDVVWVPTEQIVERMREIKDAWEIDRLRRGGERLASVARQLNALVREGRSEREVAAEVDRALSAAGFSRPAFDTIVASGPNSALPHAHPGDRQLRPGDLVVLDFGGVLDGYCVDLTRVAAIGAVSGEAQALFTAVRDAHQAALEAIRPGVQTSDIDEAARAVLGARGLGEAFLHSTGHGLGLEVHEAPRIAAPRPGSAGSGPARHGLHGRTRCVSSRGSAVFVWRTTCS